MKFILNIYNLICGLISDNYDGAVKMMQEVTLAQEEERPTLQAPLQSQLYAAHYGQQIVTSPDEVLDLIRVANVPSRLATGEDCSQQMKVKITMSQLISCNYL